MRTTDGEQEQREGKEEIHGGREVKARYAAGGGEIQLPAFVHIPE